MVWPKGKSGNPAGRPVGSRNKETIRREERQAIFDHEVSQRFEKLIAQAKPEYQLDRFMGKMAEKVEVQGTILNASISLEAIRQAEEVIKAKLVSGE